MIKFLSILFLSSILLAGRLVCKAEELPIIWRPGQDKVITSLASYKSQDIIIRKPLSDDLSSSTLWIKDMFFHESNEIDGGKKQNQLIEISKNYLNFEMGIGLYSDVAISSKTYLVEGVAGDCMLKKAFIFPSLVDRSSGKIVMVLNPFQTFGNLYTKPSRIALLQFYYDNKNKIYKIYLKYSSKLDRFYCLESDLIKQIIILGNS